jgi:hypothetical protein
MDIQLNHGWIKLHRRALDSTVFAKPIVWKVWTWCLLRARHTNKKMPFNGDDIEIKAGQFITGRTKACLTLKLTPQQYRTAINYLKSTNRITIKPTNKFSIITVKNWENYQLDKTNNPQNNQSSTSRQPTNNQPVTTNKNDKKCIKNEKNNTGRFTPPTHIEVAEQIKLKNYQNITAERFINFYGSKGWFVGKNKMVKWKLALARADKWDQPAKHKKDSSQLGIGYE